MKLLWCAFLLVIFIPLMSFGQGTIQTGFVVITPVSGTGDGLSVSETFGEQVGTSLFQSSVPQSPLVTLTNVVVNADLATGLNTGIAIVNPNNVPATITTTFRNQQGVATASRTFGLGARQQESRFVTDIFSGDSVTAAPMVGSLLISSNVPVGVLGLSFNGFSFTSLPVATQLTVNNVTTAGTTGTITTVVPVNTSVLGINTGVVPVAAPPAVPSTITQIPATFTGLVPQQSPTAITTPLTGVAPVNAVTAVPVTTPLTGVTTVVTTTSGPVVTATPVTTTVVTPSVVIFPTIAVGIGGPGALLLPQVAAGGGWVSHITIANTSGVAQAIRIDFFDPFGAPLPLPFGSSVPNVVIAPGGVATLSTSFTGI
jgi:hypothetical protein